MGRVFEALQREQKAKGKKKKVSGRDPLVVETATPEEVPDPLEMDGFELPDRIGAPSGPRSNEGMILPLPAEGEFLDPLSRSRAPSPQTGVAADGALINDAFRGEERAGSEQAATPVQLPTAAELPGFTPPLTTAPLVSRSMRLDTTRLHPRLILLTEPQLPGCEQYRTLRTQIFHAARRRLTQVIVITSAVAGEGKTSTLLNLACAIAQSKEKRVLVIDGDLRRPNVASYLGLKSETGLGEVLKGDCEALEAVTLIEDHNLYVLPVCCAVLNPTELLSSQRLGQLLAELRRYFDFILIDSPPVTPFADARLLSHQADAIVLVVRSGMAPYATVERAVETLSAERILGVVLNGADSTIEAGYYDYYYYYTKPGKRQLFDWNRLSQKLAQWRWLGQRLGLKERPAASDSAGQQEPVPPSPEAKREAGENVG
jgi:capsular exopolysaccharide synthesis family protein